jgi:site-specific DNA-methyltransferase (adenine-specific)
LVLTPAYDRDGVTLYHGDCLDILPMLTFDAIVTDPPYGIGFTKGAGGRSVVGRNRGINCRKPDPGPILGDDQPFDPSPFLTRSPCVFFGADHFHDKLTPGGSWHVWDKRAYSTIDDSFADVEFIWSSTKAKSEIIEHLWKGVQQASEKGAPKYHVSQKPVRVMVRLLEKFTKPGDVVLDPFAGSGSTGVACLKAGRRCILIEKDARYIPITIKRLQGAATPLFNTEQR